MREESDSLGCLPTLLITTVMTVPHALAFGLVFYFYWDWFFIPVAKTEFEVLLPELSWRVCSVISYTVYTLLMPLAFANFYLNRERGKEEYLKSILLPFVFMALALVWGAIIRFVFVWGGIKWKNLDQYLIGDHQCLK